MIETVNWEYVNFRRHPVVLILGDQELRHLRVDAGECKVIAAEPEEMMRVYVHPHLGKPINAGKVLELCTTTAKEVK